MLLNLCKRRCYVTVFRFKRAKTFRKLFELLEEKNKDYYLILETGCSRAKNAYSGDGMSTVLFDEFVNFYDGQVISVDISEVNCNLARSLVSDKTKIFCDDSIKFLWGLNPPTDIDLLYLDSFDINFNKPHPAMLHHLKELCAIAGKLKKGTIIAVDDNIEKSGKGGYIVDFMENLGYKKVIDGYQIGWVL
jgi:hypothetical protein